MEFPLVGGCLTDDPPISTAPFVLFSENFRWRRGLPEVAGLSAPLCDGQGRPVRFGSFEGAKLGLYTDDQHFFIGSGADLYSMDLASGTTYRSTSLMASPGPWFFAGDQDAIYGRASSFGNDQLQIIDRTTLVPTTMTSAPKGGVGGGIISNLFVLAGCSEWTADGEVVGKKNMVRWSARRDEAPGSGDAINGPFGLQDWDPSAGFTSAGQLELDDCKGVIGAGVTSLGFMVWSDRNTHVFTPVQGVYVFQEQLLAPRSLLAQGAWCEMNGAVYWYDEHRVLNVYDGGNVRQIENPARGMTANRIPLSGQDPRVTLAPFNETGELVLSWTEGDGSRRQLVYNTIEDLWYAWALDREGFYSCQNGFSSMLGVSPGGGIYVHGLWPKDISEYIYGRDDEISRAATPYRAPVVELPDPLPDIPTPIDPAVGGSLVAGSVGLAPVEPIDCWLATSFLVDSNPNRTSLKAGSIVLSHTAAPVDGAPADFDSVPEGRNEFRVTLIGYDTAGVAAKVQHENTATFPVGAEGADLRIGGRAVRSVIELRGAVWHVRLGSLFLDPDRRSRR